MLKVSEPSAWKNAVCLQRHIVSSWHIVFLFQQGQAWGAEFKELITLRAVQVPTPRLHSPESECLLQRLHCRHLICLTIIPALCLQPKDLSDRASFWVKQHIHTFFVIPNLLVSGVFRYDSCIFSFLQFEEAILVPNAPCIIDCQQIIVIVTVCLIKSNAYWLECADNFDVHSIPRSSFHDLHCRTPGVGFCMPVKLTWYYPNCHKWFVGIFQSGPKQVW